jgi:hypothetical protein
MGDWPIIISVAKWWCQSAIDSAAAPCCRALQSRCSRPGRPCHSGSAPAKAAPPRRAPWRGRARRAWRGHPAACARTWRPPQILSAGRARALPVMRVERAVAQALGAGRSQARMHAAVRRCGGARCAQGLERGVGGLRGRPRRRRRRGRRRHWTAPGGASGRASLPTDARLRDGRGRRRPRRADRAEDDSRAGARGDSSPRTYEGDTPIPIPVCVSAGHGGHPLTQLSTRASPSYKRDTLIRQQVYA